MFDRIPFNKSSFDKRGSGYTDDISISLYGNTGGIDEDLLIIYTPLPEPYFFGDADFELIPFIEVYFLIELLDNEGSVTGTAILDIEPLVHLYGDGELDIFRIGDTDISLINLKGISLLPGETITIDTDLMVVLFGLEHNVSSLTSSSKFFQLGPGLNELNVVPTYQGISQEENDEKLIVKIIWENRWL